MFSESFVTRSLRWALSGSAALHVRSSAAWRGRGCDDPVVTFGSGIARCNGVRITPGSENTNKRLVSGTLKRDGTVTREINFPVDPRDLQLRLSPNDDAVQKNSVTFVYNNENFLLTVPLTISAGALFGADYCNYAVSPQSRISGLEPQGGAGPGSSRR